MRTVTAGQAHILTHNLIQISDNQPLTSGAVSFYLTAVSGVNAGKWWTGSAWSASETAAGSGSHIARGLWRCSVASGAWAAGESYESYAIDSEGLCVFYSDTVVVESNAAITLVEESTVIQD